MLKTIVLLSWLVASYVGLVFWASSLWQVAAATVSLALAVAGVGFNVQHDGSHRAYAASRRWNRIAAWSLDLIGGSSYVWHYKHNVLHHHHTNVDGADQDIDAGPVLRMSPTQTRFWWHRFQPFYIWLLYGFLPVKWHLVDDFVQVITRRLGALKIPRPRGLDAVVFLSGKVLFVTWALVIPLSRHSLLEVAGVYAFWNLVLGITLATTFQLAHCHEGLFFSKLSEGGDASEYSWCEHQLATTADFCPDNRWLAWYLGGLNFQVVHHIFPGISHVHYPSLSRAMREACRKHGVPYHCHGNLWSALASHVRSLSHLGSKSPRLADATPE